MPVSPSLVGTVVYISDNGGASAIQPLQGGPCVTGGGGCSIGVKIPATFTGQGYITLGRPAKPGETYESRPAPSRREKCCTAAVCAAHGWPLRCRSCKQTSSPRPMAREVDRGH